MRLKNKKIVIFCATKNGIDLINFLKKKIKIDLVITVKNNNKYSNEMSSASNYCRQNKLKYFELSKYSNYDPLKKYLKNYKISYLLPISWQRIVPQWIIDKSKIVIGAHGSHQGMNLGRGRSPMNWALLTGKKKFIFSIFKISNENVDSGPILDTKKIEIEKYDNIKSLYLKYHIELSQMIIDFIKKPKKKIIKKVKKKRYLPKMSFSDGLIDWNRTSIEIYNFIRSKSSPYPNSFTILNKDKIKIQSSIPIITNRFKQNKPGTILSKLYDDSFLIKTFDGVLQIDVEKKMIKKLNEFKRFKSGNFRFQIKKIIESHNKKNSNKKINQLIYDLLK